MRIKLPKIRLNKRKPSKLAPSMDKKLKRLVSSIGFHRTLSRISNMPDESKMLESAKQVIKESRHFKGCTDDVINDAANGLIIESKKYKFKTDNYESLELWYKTVKNFGKTKIQMRTLLPRTAIFYDEVSNFKDFDGFVENVYGYATRHESDFKSVDDYIKELSDEIERSKFQYKNIIIENLDGKDKIRVSIPNSFEKLRNDLKKTIETTKTNYVILQNLYKKYVQDLEPLFDGVEDNEKQEYCTSIINATAQNPSMMRFMSDLYDKFFNPKGAKKRYREAFNELTNGAVYKTFSNANDLIDTIYFVNSAASLENAKARMKAQYDEVKGELLQKQKKRKRAATLPAQSPSKSNRRGSGRVEELRKRFESMSHGS